MQTTPAWIATLQGWYSVIISTAAVIGVGVTVWRANNRPILTKISEASSQFTRELARVERDVTEKVNAQRAHIDDTLDDYHKTVSAEINGWAKRFEDDHADIQRHDLALGEQAGRIIRMDSYREHTDRRIAEMSQRLDENTKELRDLERRMTKTVTDSEHRIIEAIHERVKMLTKGPNDR